MGEQRFLPVGPEAAKKVHAGLNPTLRRNLKPHDMTQAIDASKTSIGQLLGDSERRPVDPSINIGENGCWTLVLKGAPTCR